MAKKLENIKSNIADKESKLNVDLDAVQNIVQKMKLKEQREGISKGVSQEHLKELKDIISQGNLKNIKLDTYSMAGASSAEKETLKYYKYFKKIIDKIIMLILKNPLGKKISYYLYSANIKKSLVQHLISSSIFSILISFFITFIFIVISIFFKPILLVAFPFILIGIFLVLFLILAYAMPMKKAKSRGIYIDIELPFALRHLSTELQAGIGLYKVLQSIAKNDYGVLSEEMNRTVIEIENGTDTKTALRHAALRSQSKNYNIALFHIVRTLNTGGNLAQTINGVADSVSFDLLESAKVFGEKMNFFGIIFIFIAIVLPVFAAILGAIANAPLGQDGALFLPGVMTPTLLTIIFVIALPIIFVFLIYYIKMIEPKM